MMNSNLLPYTFSPDCYAILINQTLTSVNPVQWPNIHSQNHNINQLPLLLTPFSAG